MEAKCVKKKCTGDESEQKMGNQYKKAGLDAKISDLERESELGKSESECEMGEKGRQTPNSHCPQSMTLVTDHCQTCQKESKQVTVVHEQIQIREEGSNNKADGHICKHASGPVLSSLKG